MDPLRVFASTSSPFQPSKSTNRASSHDPWNEHLSEITRTWGFISSENVFLLLESWRMGPTNERGRWMVKLPFQASSMTLKGWSFVRWTYTVEKNGSDVLGE